MLQPSWVRSKRVASIAMLMVLAVSVTADAGVLQSPIIWQSAEATVVAQARPARPAARPSRSGSSRQASPRRSAPRQSAPRRATPQRAQPRQTPRAQPRRPAARPQPRQAPRAQPRQAPRAQPRRSNPTRRVQPQRPTPVRPQPRASARTRTQPRAAQPRSVQPRNGARTRAINPRNSTSPRVTNPRSRTGTIERANRAQNFGARNSDARSSRTTNLRERTPVREGLRERYGLEPANSRTTASDLRRQFRLGESELKRVGPTRRGANPSARGRIVELGGRRSAISDRVSTPSSLRRGANLASQRLGLGRSGRDRIAVDRLNPSIRKGAGDTSRVSFAPSLRPRRVVTSPSVGGTTVINPVGSSTLVPLAPVRHVSFSGTRYASPFRFTNFSFWWPSVSIGFGSSYAYGYCDPWIYGGYSSYYTPFRSICYASPYSYRYRVFAPCYSYRWRTYAFNAYYGFYPYYCSPYRTYYSSSRDRIITRTEVVERELTAAELQFCEGWSLLKSEDYANAAQLLYTASLDLESSALVHWFLSVALVGNEDLDLASRALDEALALDPEFLRHRWEADEHLGEAGLDRLFSLLREARSDAPLEPAALAMEGALALLADDGLRAAELRGQIAEALLNDPEAAALAEILAEVRRRGDSTEGHPLTGQGAWLVSPSCEAIPSLGLSQ